MRKLSHIAILACAAIGLAASAASCSDNSSPAPEGNNDALMLLHVESASSRAETSTPANEMMHTLRMLILDAETGNVERNFIAVLDGGTAEYTTPYMIPVKPGEKKIYLIANEASVNYHTAGGSKPLPDLLRSADIGTQAFGNTLDAIVFTPDFTKHIPLTSMYEVTLGPGITDLTLYVVRAATKFDIRFANKRHSDVAVKSLAINSVAADSYLMGHVNEADYTKDGEYWVEWLRKISDASQTPPNNTDPGNPEFNKAKGWIKDYDIPSDAHAAYTAPADALPTVAGLGTPDGIPGTASMPTIYFPESKNAPDNNGTQKYAIDLELLEDGATATVRRTLELTNLEALFRNTHMVVDITFDGTETDVNVEIDVQPYQEVKIEPIYGLLRDKQGHLMIQQERQPDGSMAWPKFFLDFLKNHPSVTRPEWDAIETDYYAVIPPVDGNMDNAKIWLKDRECCHVLGNFAQKADGCAEAGWTRPVDMTIGTQTYRYDKTKAGLIMLQHNDDHSYIAYNPDMVLVWKTTDGKTYAVEYWDETQGYFWVKETRVTGGVETIVYVEYSKTGKPTGKEQSSGNENDTPWA